MFHRRLYTPRFRVPFHPSSAFAPETVPGTMQGHIYWLNFFLLFPYVPWPVELLRFNHAPPYMSMLTYAQPLPARLLPAFFSDITTPNGCSLCPGALFPTLRLAHDSPIVRLLANNDALLLPQGHYNSTSDQYLLDNDDRIPRTIRTSTKK